MIRTHYYEIIACDFDSMTFEKRKLVKSDIAEIQLEIEGVNENNELIENTVDKDVKIIATVYVKKSDGSKVVAEEPFTIEFSFSDPSRSNASKAVSYSEGESTLGKANTLSAVFWKNHSDCMSKSVDGYKTKCMVTTITTTGSEDIGKAKVYFKPSNVGGDSYIVKATVYASDNKSVLMSKESPKFTIWRKVVLSAYEMPGFTHVSNHGTQEKMLMYFTKDTYTRYIRGPMNEIDAPFCVKYFGLWDHSTSSQRSWIKERQKTPEEIPSDEQTKLSNGPASSAQALARKQITAMATAWKDRICKNIEKSLDTWATDANIPQDAIIAVQYCHPKYDSQAPDSDAITSEWSAYPWLRIDYNKASIHPDQRWDKKQSFECKTRVYILAGMEKERYEVVIAHEIGHVTKKQFKRAFFGSSDHSRFGLMNDEGKDTCFTTLEKDILRGLKPD